MKVLDIHQLLHYEHHPPMLRCLLCSITLKVLISRGELSPDFVQSHECLEKLAPVTMETSL